MSSKRHIIKKNLPFVTKKILDADYVQVWWEDINSNSAWLKLEEARANASSNMVIMLIGMLLTLWITTFSPGLRVNILLFFNRFDCQFIAINEIVHTVRRF